MHRNPITDHTRRSSRGQALRKIPLLRQARQVWLLYSMLGFLQTIKALSARLLGIKTIELNLSRLGVPHALRLRPRSNDLLVIWSMFGNDECRLQAHGDHSPAVIVDGGAHIGCAAIHLSLQFPNATVLAVEPDADNLAVLKENCRHYSRIQIVPSALWSEQTTGVIGNPSADYWARHFSEDDRAATDHGQRRVVARTIDQILAERDLHSVDIVKLDVEGAERRIICHADANWLRTANSVIVEIHDAADISPICDHMTGAGFQHHRQAEKHIFDRVQPTVETAQAHGTFREGLL